jgi:ubiquinone/menaquinone biosynthesis C-methylase UbiE
VNRRHPIFARCFDRLSALLERETAPQREQLLAGLRGRVLEVGAGNGINFRYYPDQVDEVIAVEPEPYLRAKAQLAAARAPVPVRVCAGTASQLPLATASIDAAVASLVLCTVADVPAALAELRRVLRPGGELRFLEHVRAGRTVKAGAQRLLDRSGIWPLLGGGCHCSRATVAAIEAAGFRIQRLQTLRLGPGWLVTNPHVLGVARLRSSSEPAAGARA